MERTMNWKFLETEQEVSSLGAFRFTIALRAGRLKDLSLRVNVSRQKYLLNQSNKNMKQAW